MGADPSTLTAEQLLKKRAVDLFKVEVGSLEAYRSLVKKWHPDVNKDPLAERVFAHVTSMFHAAKRAWVDGTYPNTLTIAKSTGTYHYPYLAAVPFELGELYVCERHIIWATRREYDDLAKRWLETVKAYKFPNTDVEKKVSPFVPRNSHTIANGDRAYTIVDRPADYVRVIDVLGKRGPFDQRHVAWILSRAYKVAGFIEYCGFEHLDITPESFFIEPASHFGALLGGWFYTGLPKKKVLATPARTHHLLKAPASLDAQIRLLGRRALGITSPVQLRNDKSLADPLKSWLLGSPQERVALAERDWHKALIAAYGEKRFTELKLTTAEIYSA